jgi:outer membrane protein assembly factor BamE (lipoprotein component of BamABCDE complex)
MKKFCTVILFAFSTACSFTKHNGSQFIVHQDKIDNFAAYNPTKSSLIKNLGYPSVELDSKTWLYYYYKTENFNFLPQKIKEEAILLVYFNDSDDIVNHSYRKRVEPGNSWGIEISSSKGRQKNK